jgi:hypothetical protein
MNADLITRPFILISQTEMQVDMPAFFGVNLTISVNVGGQIFTGSVSIPNTTFSYDPPEISSVNYTIGGGVQTSGALGIELAPPPSAGFGVGGSGRRYLSESAYGTWSSNGFGACLGNYQIPGVFWQISLIIYPAGAYTRITTHYSTSTCTAGTDLFTVSTTGQLSDMGMNPTMTCGQNFEDTVSSISLQPSTAAGVNILNSQGLCPSAPTFAVGTSVSIEGCLESAIASTDANDQCFVLTFVHHANSNYGLYVIVGDDSFFFRLV